MERLKENVSAILAQVDRVYLVENGSSNIDEIVQCFKDNKKIATIDLKANKGIAAALNEGCKNAINDGYLYAITLDQDSVCYEKLVENYLKYCNLPQIGQLTCEIIDRNNKRDIQLKNEPIKIDWCITSGSFLVLDIWKKVGGFDEYLFIDGVDRDFGLNLKNNNYITYRIPYIGLLHEIGQISKVVKVFGKEHPIYNHNSFRRYYIVRNDIYLAKKYRDISLFKAFFKTLGRTIFVFVFEKQKFSKLKAAFKGFKDGFKCKVKI